MNKNRDNLSFCLFPYSAEYMERIIISSRVTFQNVRALGGEEVMLKSSSFAS